MGGFLPGLWSAQSNTGPESRPLSQRGQPRPWLRAQGNCQALPLAQAEGNRVAGRWGSHTQCESLGKLQRVLISKVGHSDSFYFPGSVSELLLKMIKICVCYPAHRMIFWFSGTNTDAPTHLLLTLWDILCTSRPFRRILPWLFLRVVKCCRVSSAGLVYIKGSLQ